jgi:tetratricopeptide (TPR) repeat protein
MRKYVTAKQRANALLRLERFEEAEAIFGQIEELVREHFDPKGPRMMANHSDRGLLYEAWGDAQRSFEAYGQAAALADEGAAKGAVENAGIVYMNYAGELAQRGMEDEALKRLAQAMERLGPLRGDGTSLASLYRLRIAQVHRKLGRHEIAREALDHALRLAAEDPPDAPAPPAIWEEDARLRLAMDDRSGALASYDRATEGCVSRGKDAAPDLAKLKAWAKEVGLEPSVSP